MEVRGVQTDEDLDQVRAMLREYWSTLAFDSEFQGFEREVDALPGAYAAPRGALLLACEGDVAIGCVAVRPLEGDICEMKRLYVRPDVRRSGAGRVLVNAIMAAARALGYRRMRLDTLDWMAPARALYASCGFREIPAYGSTPTPGLVYMEADL